MVPMKMTLFSTKFLRIWKHEMHEPIHYSMCSKITEERQVRLLSDSSDKKDSFINKKGNFLSDRPHRAIFAT